MKFETFASLSKSYIEESVNDTNNSHTLMRILNLDSETYMTNPLLDKLLDAFEIEFEFEGDEIFDLLDIYDTFICNLTSTEIEDGNYTVEPLLKPFYDKHSK